MARSGRGFVRVGLVLAALVGAGGCARAVTPLDGGGVIVGGDDVVIGPHDEGVDVPPPPPDAPRPIGTLDLLLEVDNSNSMADNQANLIGQVPRLIESLTNPPCTSPTNPSEHACNASDPSDVRVRPVVHDLHVGVIDQDLGTPGSNVPGCLNPDSGDDGLMNPIHFGQAEQHHEPMASAPPGFRPANCTDPNQFPSFITFDSGTTDATQFSHDVVCNAGLYINGCGLEQQLEAVWRALIWHDASDHAGNLDANAGFLRDDAVLAILVLSDEEDMSTVDCRYVRPGDPACPNPNALDVYNASSMAWSSSNLNLRTYLYQPCGAQDPTWPLDRYVDPNDASRGFFGLKPGHPERVVFAAITGVPLEGDGFPTLGDGSTDWDRLLGDPGPNGPDDFCGRNASGTSRVVDEDSAEGHISMRQANQDPHCSTRTVPACRRQGTRDNPSTPACSTTEQYFAWPARRIVEVARRFDQSRLCYGAPCHAGIVRSICGNDYVQAMDGVLRVVAGAAAGH